VIRRYDRLKEAKDKVQGLIPGLKGREKKSDGQDEQGSEDKEEDD